MRLSLPDVTLCAVTAINHELTVRAMEECLGHCSFADVVLIADQPVQAPFRVEVLPLNGFNYAMFVCKNLTKFTSSAFNLLVQYDGYILDPAAWSDEFLEYDYLGAKWPWHGANRRVGNSGFCLRSKKLLDILSGIPLPPTGEFVDDVFICHTIRDWLEKAHNIKIASEKIADRFSYERHIPDQPTFGFHGLFNFWRHTDDAEMEKIPSLLDDCIVSSRAFAEVLFSYYFLRKFTVFCSWYWRLRDCIGRQSMERHLLSVPDASLFIEELISIGESSKRTIAELRRSQA